jgi:hypothetical protein
LTVNDSGDVQRARALRIPEKSFAIEDAQHVVLRLRTGHVATRSKPIQTYFETGFPHGPDPFISSAATGWAATALGLAIGDDPAGSP